MKKPGVFVIVAGLSLFGGLAAAQTSPSVAPDNAKSNKVDASNNGVTADSQSNNAADIDLTKRVRQSLIEDKALSTYAHNVKIVSNNGHVTLNGVVRSGDEKDTVAGKAAAIAGRQNVTDNLKIAPSKSAE